MRVSRISCLTKPVIILFIMTLCGMLSCKDSRTSVDDAPQPALEGIVLFCVGDVTVVTTSSQEKPLAIKDTVSEGDSVKTGRQSFVTIQFKDTGVIRIQENSLVTMISLFSQDRGELFIDHGQVLSKLKRLQKGREYRIKTPTAVASVRGTEYSTGYINGKSLVAVRKGLVEVDTVAAGEKTTDKPALVGEGKTAVITKTESKQGDEELNLEVRSISEVESLTVKKISIVPMVTEPDKKTRQELKELQEQMIKEETRIDDELNPKIKKEKIISMIEKKENTLAEIREVFERIDEITLYNGRVIQGAIISRGEKYRVLTTKGALDLNENDIKKIKVMK